MVSSSSGSSDGKGGGGGFTLPGRLGDDSMRAYSDPRLDPRLAAAYKMMGEEALAAAGREPPLPPASASYQEKLERSVRDEEAVIAMVDQFADMDNMPGEDVVSTERRTISGIDGNDILLVIRKPRMKNADDDFSSSSGGKKRKTIPCIYRIHGGGMVMLSAETPMYAFLDAKIASQGVMVVSVDFRNAAGIRGPHPFPAGLNDCYSALEWIANHKESLGYSTLVVSGESGGANLSLTLTIKAKRENKIHLIDGVYVMCPYISNSYGTKTPDDGSLPSLIENDGYTLWNNKTELYAGLYALEEKDQRNPLAWPYFADPEEDLRGLPPHVLSLNELDPLRDEGRAYYYKLLEAGVRATCRIVVGTEHGSDLIMYKAIPDVFMATVRDIVSFARSL